MITRKRNTKASTALLHADFAFYASDALTVGPYIEAIKIIHASEPVGHYQL
ncbi:hypothetical protein [Pseudochryseolinea flava]|uniref:hypothetical protein n=1 Tax=Pseudochryseolinea flava TaxID=2059302 RepID=UPI001403153D|nr:hypothetical protein [Pseudochryseolinea flava]